MSLPVALQVYSVREDAARDLSGTLVKIREMGYDGVEFAGLYDHSAACVREMTRDAGLVAMSAHVPYAQLTGDLQKTLDDYQTIGCPYIAIPYMTPEDRPGGGDYEAVIRSVRAIGEACKARGMQLLYHNHDFEFVTLENSKFALDDLYDSIPAELLQTELDTCWVNVAGQSPVAYLQKYAGRAPVVHLKDYTQQGAAKGALYDLIGLAPEQKKADQDAFQFKPVGYGVQDMPAILAASLAAGAKWVVVEQDQSPERPALEAAAMSRAYLKTQGW